MGELHLDIIVDRLSREFNIEVNQGNPQVAYKEAIVTHGRCTMKFTRNRPVAKANLPISCIEIGPADEGVKGLQFINEIKGGNIPKEFIPAIEKGLRKLP